MRKVTHLPLLRFDNVTKVYQSTRAGFISRPKTSKRSLVDQEIISRSKRSPVDRQIIALKNFDLAINKGDAVGIVGESGSGKTTVAELAAGLKLPTCGTVELNGIRTEGGGAKSFKQRAQIAQFIWQDAYGSLDPRMKIAASIEEPLKIHEKMNKEERRQKAFDLLYETGLSKEIGGRYPHELSGGEAQRAVIARALAVNPKLLVCDEPASALDARIKIKIIKLLEKLQAERGLALLIITHDLPLVRRLTREVIVMRRGEVVERGVVETVMRLPGHDYTKTLLESEPVLL